jgi:hypothetical protein
LKELLLTSVASLTFRPVNYHGGCGSIDKHRAKTATFPKQADGAVLTGLNPLLPY